MDKLRLFAEKLVDAQMKEIEYQGNGYNKEHQINFLHEYLLLRPDTIEQSLSETVARKDFDKVDGVRLIYLRAAILGKHEFLTEAFSWASAGTNSQQASDYWRARKRKEQESSELDLDWLRKLFIHKANS
jgi:hypothetical protein